MSVLQLVSTFLFVDILTLEVIINQTVAQRNCAKSNIAAFEHIVHRCKEEFHNAPPET